MSVRRRIGGLFALTVVVVAAARAFAQAAPPRAAPPVPGFVPPYEIMRTVRAAGFDPLTPPIREGTIYALRATDFRGVLMRVVVDARTGAIRDANRILLGPGADPSGRLGMMPHPSQPPPAALLPYGRAPHPDVPPPPFAPSAAAPSSTAPAAMPAALPPLPRPRPAETASGKIGPETKPTAAADSKPAVAADPKPDTVNVTTATPPAPAAPATATAPSPPPEPPKPNKAPGQLLIAN